jgi:hypothetical protein
MTKLQRLPAISETEIVRAVKSYLELRGFRVQRRNVGGAYNASLQFVRFSEPGAADLTGWQIGTGRHLECEVKKMGARTNPKRDQQQREWLSRAKGDGAITLRVSSVQEADEQLAEFGLPRRLLV